MSTRLRQFQSTPVTHLTFGLVDVDADDCLRVSSMADLNPLTPTCLPFEIS